jgi:hypothetical protein
MISADMDSDVYIKVEVVIRRRSEITASCRSGAACEMAGEEAATIQEGDEEEKAEGEEVEQRKRNGFRNVSGDFLGR